MKEEDYDLVTEERDEFPKIFWDKNSEGVAYDYSLQYEMLGWSEDGREWSGWASWSYEDLVYDPFEFGIEEIKSRK